MNAISVMIKGTPYPRTKHREHGRSVDNWKACVLEHTSQITPVRGEYFLKAIFFLPPEFFSSDFPHGPDLNDLVSCLLQSLQETVLRRAPENGCYLSYLQASKERVASIGDAGAQLEIFPVEGKDAIERAVALGVPRAWAAEFTDPREDIYTLSDGEPENGTR